MCYYSNEETDIPAVGLLNFSRIEQKVPKYYKNKDINLYNTCYINASIQCLLRLDDFVKNLLKFQGGDLLSATKNLINDMRIKKACSVFFIKEAMGEKNDIYNGNDQGDANEFITNYLNDLIEETKGTSNFNWTCSKKDEKYFNTFYNKFIQRKGKSFILDLFYGVTKTETYCKNCETTSIKYNAFNILEIPIYEDDQKFNYKKNLDMNLKELLSKFISEKKSEDEKCLTCKKYLYSKISINNLPKCLIIYFKRSYSNNIINKIDIPKSINLEKYILDKSLNNMDNYFYHLKGVIFYSYSKAKVSHYKAACLVNNEKWYYFNDNYYDSDVAFRLFQDDNPILLFYEN